MENFYKSIGAMCGSSCDGIDFSLIMTNGTDEVKILNNKFFEFDKNLKNELKNFKNSISDIKAFSEKIKSKEFINLELQFSNLIANYCLDFIKDCGTDFDMFGFHGFTLFHSAKDKISYQVGNAEIIKNIVKKNIIYDFRNNDLLNGGKGAPLASIYHFLILKKNTEFDSVINIGGISNCTYRKNSIFYSTDIGPGNCLLDEWAKNFFNKEFDLDGSLSAQGSINQISANNFIDRFIFEKNVNISFDTADFSISEFRGLNKLDGLKTLTFITAELILEFCKRNNLKKSLVCGGGRKNKTLMRFLKDKAYNIDKLNYNGDFIESQAFAYLSVRTTLGKNISFPETTGTLKACTGGKIL